MSYCSGFIVGSALRLMGLPMNSLKPARCTLSSSSSISTTAADATTRPASEAPDGQPAGEAPSQQPDASVEEPVEPVATADAAAEPHTAEPSHGGGPRVMPLPTQERPDPLEFRRLFPMANGAVRACVHNQEATILVAVTIRGTGQVVEVQVPPPWVNTPAGGCIAAAVRRLRFQRFRQERFTVTWPYVIRPAAPVTEGSP